MQPIKKFISVILITLITAVFSGAAVNAAEASLPAGMLIGDQNGIHVGADGEYFIDAEALEAGDVITKRLTIYNTEPYSYKLAMTAEPLEETGLLKLLDEVRCTLEMDGKILYDGRVRGDEGINMILSALDLGAFRSGEQRILEITLTVNPDMKKYHWTASEAFFNWHFYAAQNTKPEGGPKTGEMISNSLYFLLPGIIAAAGLLLIAKRRRTGVR